MKIKNIYRKEKDLIFTRLFLLFVMLLGFFLRVVNLNYSPPSLNWDEAALGYNAFSISETLRDEYGKFLPIFTRSFDEYKSAIPIYLIIPSIKVFGLNEFGVRFPSAFLGSVNVLLIYLLSKKLFGSDKVSLFSSLLFAVEPWSVHLSRVYYEATTSLFFLLLGLVLYYAAQTKKKYYIFSAVFLVLSMFSYNSSKVIVPLLVFGIIVRDFNKLRKLPVMITRWLFGILIFSAVLFGYLAIKGEALARLSSTNILKSVQIGNNTIYGNRSLTGHTFALGYNIYFFINEIGGRFISYFSPYNLFIREPLEPHTIFAGNSIFHPFEMVFWMAGMYIVMANRKKFRFIHFMIAVSVIPAIFTWNWFQPGRTMFLFSLYSIITGLGIVAVNKIVVGFVISKKRLVGLAFYSFVVMLVLISTLYVLDTIYVQSPFRDSGHYQPGFRETVPQVMSLYDRYDKIIVETPHAQPYIFYLFYGHYSPSKYLKELNLEKIGTPRKIYDFGKIEFRKIDWTKDRNLRNTLFVGNPDILSDNLKDDGNVSYFNNVYNRWSDVTNRLVGTK